MWRVDDDDETDDVDRRPIDDGEKPSTQERANRPVASLRFIAKMK
jgi:hypothetical protein